MKNIPFKRWTLGGFLMIPATVLAVFEIWTLLAANSDENVRRLIPSTGEFVHAGLALLESATFWAAALHTGLTVLHATLIALIAGGCLGPTLAYCERIWRLSAPSIDFLRSIPVTFFVAPLALLLGSKSPQLVVALAAIPSALFLILGFRQGVVHHDPERMRSFDLYLGRRSLLLRFFRVLIPETMPDILHGIRIGISYALVIVTVLEYFGIGKDAGLGALLRQNQETYQTATVLTLMVSVGTLGFLLNKLLEGIQRMFSPPPPPPDAS